MGAVGVGWGGGRRRRGGMRRWGGEETYNCQGRHGCAIALHLDGYLDGEVAQAPVNLWHGAAATKGDCLAETKCLLHFDVSYCHALPLCSQTILVKLPSLTELLARSVVRSRLLCHQRQHLCPRPISACNKWGRKQDYYDEGTNLLHAHTPRPKLTRRVL